MSGSPGRPGAGQPTRQHQLLRPALTQGCCRWNIATIHPPSSMEMCMYLDKAALSQEKKHAVGIGKQVRAGWYVGNSNTTPHKAASTKQHGRPCHPYCSPPPQRDGVPLVTLAG
jgi:hypothetical protein